MKIRICIEPDCKNEQTTKDYCRLHYVKNWKKLRDTTKKKAAERLNRYVEGICKKHPDKYMDILRRDLRTGDDEETPARSEDALSRDDIEDLFTELGFHDDSSLDRLVSHIKIDKDF